MKQKIIFILLFFILLLLCYFYLAFDFEDKVLKWDRFLILNLRLPKLLIGVVAGIGLSIVGGLYQGLFKNPLAEPYLLGISSGSAFGAVITFYFGWDKIPLIGYPILIFNSFLSGILTVFIILFISNYKKNLSLMYLLLTGVIINTFLFSIEFLIIVFSYGRLQNVLLWLWGSLPVLDYRLLLLIGVIVFAGYGIILFNYKSVNLLSVSKEFLISKGLNLKRKTLILIFVSTIMIAGITSVCGILGFIGLIVPHIIRLIVGYDFKKIFIYSLLVGPIFIIISDTINHILFYPVNIPLGIITTLIGAPVFFYLLRRNIR